MIDPNSITTNLPGLNPGLSSLVQPPAQPMAQTFGMPQPFVWGQGGAQLTPDQLALRQRIALQNSQSDYSPIQSPWQGVARVAQNVEGALDLKNLDKQAAGVSGARSQVLAALTSGDPQVRSSAVADALAGNDPVSQKFATDVYNKDHPNNDTVNDYNFRVGKLGQQAADTWLAQQGSPLVTTTLPNGQFYNGPSNGLAPLLQANGMTQAGGPPATLPADFDFGGK